MCNRRQRSSVVAAIVRALGNSALLLLGGTAPACGGQMYGDPGDDETVADEAPSEARIADASTPLPPASGTSGPLTQDGLSNEAVTSLLKDFKYRGAGYRAVNTRAFPSTVSPDKTILIWISEEGFDAYTRISPDQAGSGAALPVGTVIVREVLKDAKLDGITVMLRLPTGAFPLGGDWWYASASATGEIKTDATAGTPLIGLLENCGTCHLRRRDDDHLFGAPAAYLTK